MKRAWWLATALLLATGLAGGFGLWRAQVERAALERTFTAAEASADARRWTEVRALLETHARRRGRPAQEDEARRWTMLEYRAAAGLRDFPALEALLARQPALITLDEEAALWLWRLRKADDNEAAAEALRTAWRGRKRLPVAWDCAEIDALIAARRLEDARALLAAKLDSKPEPKPVPLLLRAALLSTDPTAATRIFDQAYRSDPTDPDLRELRASILERAGQTALARVDYVAALVADPRNPLRRDALASFYLRQNRLDLAVETWREGLDETSPDFLWVRATFWGRILGLDAPEAATQLPETRRRRFAGWFATLPRGAYWDETGYAALHLPSAHAADEPAVHWSRLLQALKTGDRASAATLLAEAPSRARTLAPLLHATLRLNTAVRAGAEPAATGITLPPVPADAHTWWSTAAAATRGEPTAAAEFTTVARGPADAVGALLAAGWIGPALDLAESTSLSPQDCPTWIRYGLLQARRLLRGPADALRWAETLPSDPNTDYLRAELLFATPGREAEATSLLRQLAVRDDDIGFAAGWLLATWSLENGRPDDARETLRLSPTLIHSDRGAELRARLALAAGDEAEATHIYQSLANRSLEAGAYLARQAFARNDFAKARQITEFWLEREPDNLQLRANLQAIETAEAATATPK